MYSFRSIDYLVNKANEFETFSQVEQIKKSINKNNICSLIRLSKEMKFPWIQSSQSN